MQSEDWFITQVGDAVFFISSSVLLQKLFNPLLLFAARIYIATFVKFLYLNGRKLHCSFLFFLFATVRPYLTGTDRRLLRSVIRNVINCLYSGL